MSTSRAPAPSSSRPIQVLSFKNVREHFVRFLGELRGALIHWDGDNSIPCLGGACERAIHDKQELMYRGFAPAEYWDADVNRWFQTVVEATENFEEELRGITLRATMWSIQKRKVKGKWLPMTGVYLEDVSPANLRETFDVSPVLTRMYRGRTPIFGAINRQTPKIMAEGSEAPGPLVLQKHREAPPRPQTDDERREYRKRMGLPDEPLPGNGKSNGPNGKGASYV